VRIAPALLAVAAASSFSTLGAAKAIDWRCHAGDSNSMHSFLIDLANRTIDGAPARVALLAAPGAFQLEAFIGREATRYSLSMPSGIITITTSSGQNLRVQCSVPPDAMLELALVDPRPQSSATPPLAAGVPPDSPSSAPTQQAQDARYVELARASKDIQERVRAGKLKAQEAAQLSREKYFQIFPEQMANPLVNEWFAFAEVIAEKVDQKKLTAAEGRYELAHKQSELQERQMRLQAEMAARTGAAEQAGDAAAKNAADSAATARAADLGEQRLAIEKQMLEQQQAMERQQRLRYLDQQQALRDKQRQENLAAFLRLLNPPRPKMTTCTGGWLGQTWTSNCTGW
jgi:hypothetical protein